MEGGLHWRPHWPPTGAGKLAVAAHLSQSASCLSLMPAPSLPSMNAAEPLKGCSATLLAPSHISTPMSSTPRSCSHALHSSRALKYLQQGREGMGRGRGGRRALRSPRTGRVGCRASCFEGHWHNLCAPERDVVVCSVAAKRVVVPGAHKDYFFDTECRRTARKGPHICLLQSVLWHMMTMQVCLSGQSTS